MADPKVSAAERKAFTVSTADKIKAALGIDGSLIAAGRKLLRDQRATGSLAVDSALEAAGVNPESARIRRLRAAQDKTAGIHTNK